MKFITKLKSFLGTVFTLVGLAALIVAKDANLSLVGIVLCVYGYLFSTDARVSLIEEIILKGAELEKANSENSSESK